MSMGENLTQEIENNQTNVKDNMIYNKVSYIDLDKELESMGID